MKKPFSRFFAAALVCLLLCPLLTQRAEAADCSFSGASSLRAGNSVTVTVSLSGSDLLAIDANLRYDSDSLELLGTRQLIGDSWDMQQNGSKFILYDTAQTAPISSSTNVFSVTFRVKSDVDAGQTVSADISGTVSDGTAESSFSASWSATIKPPLSSDARLTDLRCGDAKLSFTGATEYYITVPYAVSSLDLDWDLSHSGAEAAVSGNKLRVGANTVTITVTAENGNVKRYYIYATRQQDPAYTPSTDARLKSLTVSAGTLSPAFDPDITEYVVYLSNETERLELTGVAMDDKAQNVRQVGSSNLMDGETLLMMRCTAEDGTTMLDYQIHVIRMPAFVGTLPEITVPPEDPQPVTPAAPAEPAPELPLQITLPVVGQISLWWVAGIALFLLTLLCLLFWSLGRRSGRKKALCQSTLLVSTENPPAAQEPLQTTPTSAADDTLFTEERPFTREEVTPAAPPQHRPDKPLPELDGMSLDDLLEDIRNM